LKLQISKASLIETPHLCTPYASLNDVMLMQYYVVVLHVVLYVVCRTLYCITIQLLTTYYVKQDITLYCINWGKRGSHYL